MARHQRERNLDKYDKLFKNTCDRVLKSLGPKPFHIKRGINVAVYDSVMVAFAKNSKEPADISSRYKRLLDNPSYNDTIAAHTTDTDTVIERHELAQKVLFG